MKSFSIYFFWSKMIYKIVCEETDEIYVGSTIVKYLCNRMCQHRFDCKSGRGSCCSNQIVKYESSKIKLLEKFEYTDKSELREREQLHINYLRCLGFNVINITRAHSTRKGYYRRNREKMLTDNKKWRSENKDKIAEINRKYRVKNKEKKALKDKEYAQKNKDKIKKYKAQYYIKNKDKINERTECICGSFVTKRNRLRHSRIKKHLACT